jgi:hypothetical protein
MSIKILIFSFLIGFSFLVDVALGTANKPVLLIFVCAIIALYEFVSPYVYTPS